MRAYHALQAGMAKNLFNAHGFFQHWAVLIKAPRELGSEPECIQAGYGEVVSHVFGMPKSLSGGDRIVFHRNKALNIRQGHAVTKGVNQ